MHIPKDDGRSHHPFATDRADFNAEAVLHCQHERTDAIDREIDLLNRASGFVKNLLIVPFYTC